MYDLIIIGAGPAGLTAALYAGRFRLNTLILERMSVGGQIIFSSAIENYPGFPGGVSTFELIERFKKQIDELGIQIENKEVLEIKPSSGAEPLIYIVQTGGETYQARSIIVATGAQARKLGIEGEDEFTGRGVSYCATCDGPLFRDKDVVVIGGGDRAVEEAIFLSAYAKSIMLIHRRSEFRASRILEEKLKQNPKINLILENVAEKILGRDRVEQVLLKNLKTNSENKVSCQGVFIYVGIKPNTDFLKNFLEIDERGFIITDQQMQSCREGIFACGDCRKRALYQVITACAEGAVAADSAHKYLVRT